MGKKQNIQETVPMFMVSDMGRSLDFYVGRIGFTIVNQWAPEGKIKWCRIERDQAMLMLEEHYKMETGSIKGEGKVGTGVSISFNCNDALALYHEFQEKGANPTEPFVGNNMWVIFLKDADGYKLSFQSATDVQEETMYSDWKSKSI